MQSPRLCSRTVRVRGCRTRICRPSRTRSRPRHRDATIQLPLHGSRQEPDRSPRGRDRHHCRGVRCRPRAHDLPLWLGGHSFGGRMASHAVLDRGLESCRADFLLVPPSPVGQPSHHSRSPPAVVAAADAFPFRALRDELASRELLEQVVSNLPTAQLHWLDTADHGYHVLKRTRTSTEDVFEEMARVTCAFIEHS